MPVSSATSSRTDSSERRSGQDTAQIIDQLAGQRGEVVDEVERVLDLVRDAGGKLAERGELLRLHEPVLRGPQIFERARQFAGARLHLVEQADILDGDTGLVGERLERARSAAA